jgi:hypothetical protein
MGAKSGIKWDGISEVQTQETVEIIGAKAQIILRDPKTQQEWIVSSDDYINALVDLGVINTGGGSGWELLGNAGTTAGTNFIGTTDAVDFVVKTDDTEHMRVLATGEVGIGTASPNATLDVLGAFNVSSINGYEVLTLNSSGLNQYISDVNGNLNQISNTIPALAFNASSSGGTNAQLTVFASGDITLTGTGNVGIGTATPSQKLDVDGNIQLTGALITVPQYAAPLTGDTVTSDGSQQLVINPAGTLLALTVDFPATPVDGQRFDISCTQIITGLTLTAAATIFGTLTTFAAADAFAGWVYSGDAAAWVRQH